MEKNPVNAEVLFSAKEVANLVSKLSQELSLHIEKTIAPAEVPLFIGVLNGAFIFLADLIRKIDCKTQVDFVKVSSYGAATKSSGEVKLEFGPKNSVQGKDVFIVDEIIDTGRTLLFLKNYFKSQGAKNVYLVALLDKKIRREVAIDPDFSGIEIPDEFVIGYGLDWAESYRDLSDIQIVKT